jgi:hypothetical protein
MNSIIRQRVYFNPSEEISSNLEAFPTPVPIPTTANTRAPCAGDADCACWSCIRELAEERNAFGWRDESFGIGLPPIIMGGSHGV